jgi:hypothetical protein
MVSTKCKIVELVKFVFIFSYQIPYFGINPPNADRKEKQAIEIAGKFAKADRFLKFEDCDRSGNKY